MILIDDFRLLLDLQKTVYLFYFLSTLRMTEEEVSNATARYPL